jgi:putative holliday junction resolvase
MPDQTLLAFDFGMKKIGVAVGQTITESATPLVQLAAKDGIPAWEALENLMKTWKADALIVGIPYNMDGSDQEMTFAAKKFGHRLQDRFKRPVYFVDERLSSIEARRLYDPASDSLDSYAAKLILEAWLRERTP